MAFWDIFQSRDKKKRLSHVRNVVVMMMADGKIDSAELLLLAKIAQKAGITEKELKKIMKHPADIEFYVPQSVEERVEQLLDMTMMMMVDGNIADNEMILCKAVAVKLGFSPKVVDKIIRDILEVIQKEKDFPSALGRLRGRIDPSLN